MPKSKPVKRKKGKRKVVKSRPLSDGVEIEVRSLNSVTAGSYAEKFVDLKKWGQS